MIVFGASSEKKYIDQKTFGTRCSVNIEGNSSRQKNSICDANSGSVYVSVSPRIPDCLGFALIEVTCI